MRAAKYLMEIKPEPLVVDIDAARRQIDWHEARAASMAQTHIEEVGKLHEEIGRLKYFLREFALSYCSNLSDWQAQASLDCRLPDDLARMCLEYVQERRGR